MGWGVTNQIIGDNSVEPINFVLHAGDVAYAGTGKEWEIEVSHIQILLQKNSTVTNNCLFRKFGTYGVTK